MSRPGDHRRILIVLGPGIGVADLRNECLSVRSQGLHRLFLLVLSVRCDLRCSFRFHSRNKDRLVCFLSRSRPGVAAWSTPVKELLQPLYIDDPTSRKPFDPDTDTWSVGRAV